MNKPYPNNAALDTSMVKFATNNHANNRTMLTSYVSLFLFRHANETK